MSSTPEYSDISSFLEEVGKPMTMGDFRDEKMRPHNSIEGGDIVRVKPRKGLKEGYVVIDVHSVSGGRVCGQILETPWDPHKGYNWQGFSCGAKVSVSIDRVRVICHNPALSP